MTITAGLAIGLIAIPVVAVGQVIPSTETRQVSVCDIANQLEQMNGKILTVRSVVQFGFEDFELPTAGCTNAQIAGIWLEYGKGPKWQPTAWCCGDTTPRDSLSLLQNADFRSFHRFLTSQSRKRGCHENECLKYSVTASITGRLDAVSPTDGYCTNAGYGHFGFFCARIVIARVSNVVAERTSTKHEK